MAARAAVVNAVHLPLLCVLALGLGTHRAYGIVGAGTSSLVAQTCGFAFALWAVARRPRLQVLRSWRIDPRLVLGSARLSWPQFAYLVLIIGAEPITVGLLAAQGVATVAAFRALTIVNDLVLVVPDALSDAAQIVLGQRIGARDASGAERFLRESVRVNVLACVAVGAGVAALAWPLAAACTWNAALATAAAGPLAIQAGLMLPIKGYALAAAAPIRAAGDTRFMMLVGASASALALIVTALSIHLWRFGLYCVPLAWGLAWILRSALTARRVRRGDWRTKVLAIEGRPAHPVR